MKTATRPATARDILGFYGRSSEKTIRAQVWELDGEPAAVAGVYRLGAARVVFSDIRPGVPKMAIWRQAKAFMDDLKAPALCIAEANSGPFLERLGWAFVGSSEDGDVYQWRD